MASGDTLAIWTAQAGIPPASSAATFGLRNQHVVALFDDAANESLIFEGVLPRDYGGGGITVYLHYSMASATTLTVDWDISFERVGDGQQDVDSDGFATARPIDNTTVPGTSGHVDILNEEFTNGAQIDSIAVGEKFRVKITRDAVSDDAGGDAELHAIELKET